MRALAGTVAVVTGAASGIGRALALRLAQEGCMLALGDIDAAGLAESADAIRQIGVRVSTHQVDVSDAAAMEQFRDAVLREHGRVALLVNNAGVAIAGTVAELSLDDIAWLIGINFWGVVHGAKLFLPVLQQQYDAHIVNISSIFGIVAPPGQAAYAASKFAVRGFSEALRHELRQCPRRGRRQQRAARGRHCPLRKARPHDAGSGGRAHRARHPQGREAHPDRRRRALPRCRSAPLPGELLADRRAQSGAAPAAAALTTRRHGVSTTLPMLWRPSM
jgi:NADP-dependent 3-hydroxy acid dehydrogenase YdfG